MLIKLDVDSDLYRQIENLIKGGKYEDIYQFIKIAMTNQIQEERSSVALTQPNPPQTSSSSAFQQMKDNAMQELRRMLSDTPLEKSQIPPPISNLIWSFYNRFFPVKIVIRQLAILLTPQKTWIELNILQENAFDLAESISSKLKDYEEEKSLVRNQKLSTGLPIPTSELASARGKYQKQKIQSKIQASKSRFIDQFVGRQTKKQPPDFRGACFEMGLMSVKVVNSICYVTLTDIGKDFALMENPILDDDGYESAFSYAESKFVLDNIITRFDLENIIVKRILVELKKEELSSEQIDKIFVEEKIKYYNKISQLSETEKVKIKDSIVGERVATMGRLSELRIVIWKIDTSGKSKYSLNEAQIDS